MKEDRIDPKKLHDANNCRSPSRVIFKCKL